MLVRALLQTSLVLWLAQQTLQGGVRPQSVSWGRVLPARGVGIGLKPGGAHALGSQYGSKAMKTGNGRHPVAPLGVGSYRSLGLGSRPGLKQGGYAHPGSFVLGVGLGTMPGYGPVAGMGFPGARPGIGMGYPTAQRVEEHKPGYIGGGVNYLGANPHAGSFGPGVGQGAYLGGAAGKHRAAAAAALGQGGYPQGGAGKSTGYNEGVAGHLGAVAGNGYGYENGYSDGYGAGLDYPAELADGAESKAGKRKGLGAGGYGGQVQGAYGALGAGLESNGGKYGGGAAQVPYGNAPVIPSGLEGEGGYPYGAQQLGLAAEGAKTSDKYGGVGAGYGAQQTGYGAQLGLTQDALGEQAGKYGGVNGAFGKGHKG